MAALDQLAALGRDVPRRRATSPILPEWPGVPATVAEAREHPESQAGVGIDQVDRAPRGDRARASASPPVLVGHSFGGLVVQALLDRGLGRAGVAIDPAPIRGVLRLPAGPAALGAPGARATRPTASAR